MPLVLSGDAARQGGALVEGVESSLHAGGAPAAEGAAKALTAPLPDYATAG